MEKASRKEEGRDGVDFMDESSPTKSSSAAREPTREFIINRRTQNKITGERSCKNISNIQNHGSSSNVTAANANSSHHKKRFTESSKPYTGKSVERTSDHAAAAERSMAANDELKFIENIADHLCPNEVKRFLFLGHEDEDRAYSFLRPRGQPIDLKKSCIYCWQSILDRDLLYSSRSCGHHFHMTCLELQSYSMKEKHLGNQECIFCGEQKGR